MKADNSPKSLICYKEGRTYKWVVSTNKNEESLLYLLMVNPKIQLESIIIIPIFGLSFVGAVRMGSQKKFEFYDFFKEYGEAPTITTKFNREAVARKLSQIAEKSKKDKEEVVVEDIVKTVYTEKYGFISPDGDYYRCEFMGHGDLAFDICDEHNFPYFNSAEAYLEEHGWCKVYNPCDNIHKYAVYVGRDFVLTKEQFAVLQTEGLENAYGVTDYLVRE